MEVVDGGEVAAASTSLDLCERQAVRFIQPTAAPDTQDLTTGPILIWLFSQKISCARARARVCVCVSVCVSVCVATRTFISEISTNCSLQ